MNPTPKRIRKRRTKRHGARSPPAGIGAEGGSTRDGKGGGEGNNYDDEDDGDGEDGEVQGGWGEERSSDCSSGDNDDESGSQQSETHDPAASKRWTGIKKGVTRVAVAKSVGRAVLQGRGGRAESGGGSGSAGEGGVEDEREGTHDSAASKRWTGIKNGVRRVAVAKSVGRAVLQGRGGRAESGGGSGSAGEGGVEDERAVTHDSAASKRWKGIKNGVRRVAVAKSVGRAVLRRGGSGGGGSVGDSSDCSDVSLMTGSDEHEWSEREEERVLSRVASHRMMSVEHGEELETLRESYDMIAEELTALEGEHEDMEGRLAAVTQDKMNVRSEPGRDGKGEKEISIVALLRPCIGFAFFCV